MGCVCYSIDKCMLCVEYKLSRFRWLVNVTRGLAFAVSTSVPGLKGYFRRGYDTYFMWFQIKQLKGSIF